MHDVIGLEVDAGELALGVGGGKQAQPEAHATAELEVAEGFALMVAGGLVTLEQGGEIQPGWGQLAVGTAGVGGGAEVAVIPGHGIKTYGRQPERSTAAKGRPAGGNTLMRMDD